MQKDNTEGEKLLAMLRNKRKYNNSPPWAKWCGVQIPLFLTSLHPPQLVMLGHMWLQQIILTGKTLRYVCTELQDGLLGQLKEWMVYV